MNLEDYKTAAENRAQFRIASRICNDSLLHANILVDAMLRHTRCDEDLYIYSGTLPKDTYRSLLTCQAKSIHILLDEDADLHWLFSAPHRPEMSICKIKQPRVNHFLFTTGGFFRFEKDKSRFEAEANFNEPAVCQVLRDAFDRYKKDAEAMAV